MMNERQQHIAQLLSEKSYLAVDSLASRFSVTTQTVRRDINEMCENGMARRVHGGVGRGLMAGNLDYGIRKGLNSEAKQAIAKSVAAVIPNGSVIAFSIGTTPELVAAALLGHDELRVFTNNLSIAVTACRNPSFDVNIVGGRARNKNLDVFGPDMAEFISSYRLDFGIYGVAGVGIDGGLLDFTREEVMMRELIRENCQQSFLVLDSSKFSRAAHVRGGLIDDADTVFCDREPPLNICKILEKSETELVICPENSFSHE